jgi:hypothetical protein
MMDRSFHKILQVLFFLKDLIIRVFVGILSGSVVSDVKFDTVCRSFAIAEYCITVNEYDAKKGSSSALSFLPILWRLQ